MAIYLVTDNQHKGDILNDHYHYFIQFCDKLPTAELWHRQILLENHLAKNTGGPSTTQIFGKGLLLKGK